jgi:hypothetical protein
MKKKNTLRIGRDFDRKTKINQSYFIPFILIRTTPSVVGKADETRNFSKVKFPFKKVSSVSLGTLKI